MTWGELPPDKTVVSTYAQFGVWVKDNPAFAANFEVIICDEAHNIQRNPLHSRSIRITGKSSTPIKPYTVEQMRYLVQHIADVRKPMDRNYLALHALHPLRPEEILGLQWQDIDFVG